MLDCIEIWHDLWYPTALFLWNWYKHKTAYSVGAVALLHLFVLTAATLWQTFMFWLVIWSWYFTNKPTDSRDLVHLCCIGLILKTSTSKFFTELLQSLKTDAIKQHVCQNDTIWCNIFTGMLQYDKSYSNKIYVVVGCCHAVITGRYNL